jgi:hypothetical protein
VDRGDEPVGIGGDDRERPDAFKGTAICTRAKLQWDPDGRHDDRRVGLMSASAVVADAPQFPCSAAALVFRVRLSDHRRPVFAFVVIVLLLVFVIVILGIARRRSDDGEGGRFEPRSQTFWR